MAEWACRPQDDVAMLPQVQGRRWLRPSRTRFVLSGDEPRKGHAKPLRASLAEGLVDFLNDGPATGFDQHDAVA